jgi:hypothetical protein
MSMQVFQPVGNDGGISRKAPVGYRGAEREHRLRRAILRRRFCRGRSLSHEPEATQSLPPQRTLARLEA